MNKLRKNHIVVFEHEKLRISEEFDKEKLSALQKYYGSTGVPYYSLIHNGVKFCSYVGVIQVGNLIIEVLPKADKNVETDSVKWRNILIDMVRTVHKFDVQATSQSHLKIRPNTILDLYIEIFIREIEYLIRNGLIKQYRKETGNVSALKGNLHFSRHIQENLIHQERFFVRHSTYDVHHLLHEILYQAITLIKNINTNISLISRINALLLDFPEMSYKKITEASFKRIVFNRKNEAYRKSFEIAKFLLLQFHPDISMGNNHVLALMFDMNSLWEKFIYISLKKHLKTDEAAIRVQAQNSINFWEHEKGSITKVRPDILVSISKNKQYIIDTKWKNLNGNNPTVEDLRQMYVYHEYFNAEKVALLYPNDVFPTAEVVKGKYSKKKHDVVENLMECSIMPISVKKDVREWQKSIGSTVYEWVEM